MKITYKNVITILKFLTTASFIIALGFKLYNIYKYGGPKKPDKPIERDDDDDDDDMEVTKPRDYPSSVKETEAYDSVEYDSDEYAQDKAYTEN